MGTFKVSYETELDYQRFSEIELLPNIYTKEAPYYDSWGKDKITYIEYTLNNSEFTAHSDIPFFTDIYTMNGDMIASVRSIDEKDGQSVHIKFANKKWIGYNK